MLYGINPKWFYHSKREACKLNWFAYEYSCELYEQIQQADSLKAYRKKYSKDEISRFCAYFARRIRGTIVDRYNSNTEAVVFESDFIFDYYLDATTNETNRLINVAIKAWHSKIEGCGGCPNGCLAHPFDYTLMLEREYQYQMED